MAHVITEARAEDAAALETLACAAFTENFGYLYTAENLTGHLNTTCSAAFFMREMEKGCRIAIARADDTAIGYIKYGDVGLPIAHTPNGAELHRLYVLSSHQGAGIGKMLMQHAFADMRMQKAPAVFLGAWENNFKAQAFYARYGFVPVGEYDYHVGTQTDREIILRKTAR